MNVCARVAERDKNIECTVAIGDTNDGAVAAWRAWARAGCLELAPGGCW